MTATRASGLTASPIRAMSAGAPPGTISLALGEPGWPMPIAARRALADLGATTGPLPYGPNSALPELVDAIARQHARAEGLPLPGEAEVMVTAGSQAALFALFQAHVEAGSTVLVPDPGFVSYATLARLCQARPVGYPLGPGGRLDAAAVLAVLAEHRDVSLLVLNHPANPTGGLADATALVEIATACAQRGVLLVSDEVYRELWVDERPCGMHEAAGPAAGVVLGSTSKAFGAPGLRVGWAVGPAAALAPARLVHSAMNTAPARPSQAAAGALLAHAAEVLAETRAHLAERWALAERRAPGLLVAAGPGPRAGFYLWVPLPAALDAVGRDRSTTEAALALRDTAGVSTVPGDAFGPRGAGYLRVSLGGPLTELEEGLARLAPWWER